MSNNINRYKFQPGAMSIIQMGEELIGHPTTAINELVKNSYDADALNCKIYINAVQNNSFVCIFDDGSGMGGETLFGDWLKPSISSKRKENAVSAVYERRFLGSKGIGRLAAMALGQTLTVISKKESDASYNWISINRDSFKTDDLLNAVDFPGGQVDSINAVFDDKIYLQSRGVEKNQDIHEYIKFQQIDKFEKGTLILVENVDQSLKVIQKNDFEGKTENIDEISFEETSIYRSLSILITPLKTNSDIQDELKEKGIITSKRELSNSKNKFDVFFGISSLAQNTSFNLDKIAPISLLEKYDYRILGKVSASGEINAEFEVQRLIEDSFTRIIQIPAESVFASDYKRLKSKKPENIPQEIWNDEAGEFYFDIRIYDRGEEDSKNKLFSLIQASSNSHKKKIIDNLLGLRISKNGFGVKPYGDESVDWLGLSQIRVQNPGQSLSINQILGYVFFYSPENDGLKEKTNREGFYENKAFIDVKHILQIIFKNVGQERYHYRLKNNLGRQLQNRLRRPNAEAYMAFLIKNETEEKLIKRSEKFIDEVTTALDSMEDTLSFSQRLASLGTGLELVYHELAQPISKIGASRAILNRKSEKIVDSELRDAFIKEISHIATFVAELDELKSSLKPAIGKSKQQIFSPANTFRKVCHLFKKDFEDYNIKAVVQNNIEDYEIDDYEYCLWISFLNIVNNAVYWMKLDGKSERSIVLGIEKKRIMIQNTGPLIPEENLEFIFEYGYTLKKEKNATGLGLAFSKNMLNLNNWDIFAENSETGPKFLIYKMK